MRRRDRDSPSRRQRKPGAALDTPQPIVAAPEPTGIPPQLLGAPLDPIGKFTLPPVVDYVRAGEERHAEGRIQLDGGTLDIGIIRHQPRGPWWKWVVHNCVAHPLLVIWPRVGWWLHSRTEPPPLPPNDFALFRETFGPVVDG